MQLVLNNEYDFYGFVKDINDSTYDTYSIVIQSANKVEFVGRLKQEEKIDKDVIYHFHGKGIDFKGKVHILISSYKKLDEENIPSESKDAVKYSLIQMAEVNEKECLDIIESKLNQIENVVLKDITSTIYNEYKNDFVNYPAAHRFHHAYKSGLLLHTSSMLKLADAYISIYKHVNQDLIYSGIILHDIMKIKEINVNGKEYTLEGKLIGHISLISKEIEKVAALKGYSDLEEVTLLEHIVISHHEEPNFGSPKRPQIIEAEIVHLCDFVDAKMQPIIEELDKTLVGEFTDPIPVSNKDRYYKHKLSK